MRIGIYSGTFDPVHKGHIAFALESIESAKLDKVYFAPEIKPRRKQQSSHVAHRLAMLNLAVRSYKKLAVLELPDAFFTPLKTYGRLRAKFPEDEIILLVGEDLLENMHLWPHIEILLPNIELAVGLRKNHSKQSAKKLIAELPAQPKKSFFIKSVHAPVSSMHIRESLIANKNSKDIVESVAKYAKEQWLYHDISKSKP